MEAAKAKGKRRDDGEEGTTGRVAVSFESLIRVAHITTSETFWTVDCAEEVWYWVLGVEAGIGLEGPTR